jgi:exodeoxyribonuclease-3
MGRLPVLLRWLKETTPDIVCLQELKAPQEKFPESAIREAGYQALWHGQKSWNGVAILARDTQPKELRRELPGDPNDLHSRYIEALVDDVVICCLYLPNGNPCPGPKFDYKLDWFKRLNAHAKELLKLINPSYWLVISMLCLPSWMCINRNGGLMMLYSGQKFEMRSSCLPNRDGQTR